MIVSRNATFLEKEFIFQENSGSKLDLQEARVENEVMEQEQNPQEEEVVVQNTREPRRSGRIR